jgi:hypothetical protein
VSRHNREKRGTGKKEPSLFFSFFLAFTAGFDQETADLLFDLLTFAFGAGYLRLAMLRHLLDQGKRLFACLAAILIRCHRHFLLFFLVFF